MKNLYVFGDSFSTNYSATNEVSIEESWPVLLSNKLGYELKSYASPGISNYGILENIYYNLNLLEIDESDIIIISITFYDRLFDFWKSTGVDLENDTIHFTKKEISFYQEKILDTFGMERYAKNSLAQFDFIINSLKKITPNVLFWNIDNCNLPIFRKIKKENPKNYVKPFDKTSWIPGILQIRSAAFKTALSC